MTWWQKWCYDFFCVLTGSNLFITDHIVNLILRNNLATILGSSPNQCYTFLQGSFTIKSIRFRRNVISLTFLWNTLTAFSIFVHCSDSKLIIRWWKKSLCSVLCALTCSNLVPRRCLQNLIFSDSRTTIPGFSPTKCYCCVCGTLTH